jgi:hypothetical protein
MSIINETGKRRLEIWQKISKDAEKFENLIGKMLLRFTRIIKTKRFLKFHERNYFKS